MSSEISSGNLKGALPIVEHLEYICFFSEYVNVYVFDDQLLKLSQNISALNKWLNLYSLK